jgi:acyl-[acyl-carrier-protein] desaturase
MAVTRAHKLRMYRQYMEFFEIAERRRRWNLWDSIDWDEIRPELNDESDAVRLETFCGVELYVPDYTEHGLNVSRDDFGQAWFAANWGYEESKHSLVFREYLMRAGLRTEEQLLDYEDMIFARKWISPATTPRQTSIYGSFQEVATYHIYSQQRQKAIREGNTVLERIMQLVGADEAAHAGFYRNAVAIYMEEDPQGTLEDLARIVMTFEMPGAPLIPNYEQRVLTEGVGLTKRQFLEFAIFPTIRHFGTTRSELLRAMRQIREKEAAEKAALEREGALEPSRSEEPVDPDAAAEAQAEEPPRVQLARR